MRKFWTALATGVLGLAMAVTATVWSPTQVHAYTSVPSDCYGNVGPNYTYGTAKDSNGVSHNYVVDQYVSMVWDDQLAVCNLSIFEDTSVPDGTGSLWWSCINLYLNYPSGHWTESCGQPYYDGSDHSTYAQYGGVPYGEGYGICQGPDFIGQIGGGPQFHIPQPPVCFWTQHNV